MGELGTKNRRMGSEKEKVGLGGQWARKYIPPSSFSALAMRRRRRGEFLGRRLERQHLLFRASKKSPFFSSADSGAPKNDAPSHNKQTRSFLPRKKNTNNNCSLSCKGSPLLSLLLSLQNNDYGPPSHTKYFATGESEEEENGGAKMPSSNFVLDRKMFFCSEYYNTHEFSTK